MRVSLHYEEQVGAFDFHPASVTWQRQSGQFVVGHPTGQTKELARVFIKKWQGRTAPAHRLLIEMTTGKRRLPSTPAPVGYAQDSSGHYYFSENLPKEKYRLLEKMISGGGNDAPTRTRLENVLIERNLGEQVVRAAASLFANVNRRGFVYPDFTHKNIMVELATSKCLLIDLDSCIPSDTLPVDRSGMGGLGSEFSIVYWRAWHSAVGVFTPEMLSRTMVLSFAAVWARAVALLRRGENPTEVQRLLRGPSEADQMPMWKALESGNRNGFREYFALAYGSDSDPLFGSFRAMFVAMKNGIAVDWSMLVKTCEGLFQVVRAAEVRVQRVPDPPSPPLPLPVPRCRNLSIANDSDWVKILFGFEGSIDRKTFFLASIGCFLASAGVFYFKPEAGFLVMGLPYVLAALCAKRSHDFGSKGFLPSLTISILVLSLIIQHKILSIPAYEYFIAINTIVGSIAILLLAIMVYLSIKRGIHDP